MDTNFCFSNNSPPLFYYKLLPDIFSGNVDVSKLKLVLVVVEFMIITLEYTGVWQFESISD